MTPDPHTELRAAAAIRADQKLLCAFATPVEVKEARSRLVADSWPLLAEVAGLRAQLDTARRAAGFGAMHWYRRFYEAAAQADTAEARLAEARRTLDGRDELLAQLVDSEDCWHDHNGGCQAHGYLDGGCPMPRVKELLGPRPSSPGTEISSEQDDDGPACVIYFPDRPAESGSGEARRG